MHCCATSQNWVITPPSPIHQPLPPLKRQVSQRSCHRLGLLPLLHPPRLVAASVVGADGALRVRGGRRTSWSDGGPMGGRCAPAESKDARVCSTSGQGTVRSRCQADASRACCTTLQAGGAYMLLTSLALQCSVAAAWAGCGSARHALFLLVVPSLMQQRPVLMLHASVRSTMA